MSMTRINTNIEAMMGQARLKTLEFSLNRTMEHLSTGLKINRGSDGPSELGLMTTFDGQIRGTRAALQNAEDALSLVDLADTSLSNITDMLQRMRELSVRASTDATMSTASRKSMESEVDSLRTEITRIAASVSFNQKLLFFSGQLSMHTVQLGPDNNAAYQISIRIPYISAADINGRSLANLTLSGGVSAALSSLGIAASALVGLSELQSILGAQAQMIERKIEELTNSEINMSAARSRIADADMAFEVSEFARQQVIAQAATAMIAQANSQPQTVLQLLGV